MIVRFLCNFVSAYGFDGWNPESTRLSGTEESIVEWAKRLAVEHEVEVYHNGIHGEWDGVKYLDRSQYQGGHGVTINIKSSDIAPQEPTWYLTNEIDAAQLDLSRFEGVILPSKWAVDHIRVNNPNVLIVPHGFDSQEIYPDEKIDKQCLYASSPDRGLSTALEVWPEVYRAHPDALLLITYGVIGVSEPGVICMGDVDEETMNSLYKTSDIWVHPANGGELFCMAGIKAQAAGCVPLYFPTMALAETVRHGKRSNPGRLASDWIKVLGDDKYKARIRTDLSREKFTDWQGSVNILLDVIKLK